MRIYRITGSAKGYSREGLNDWFQVADYPAKSPLIPEDNLMLDSSQVALRNFSSGAVFLRKDGVCV